MELKLFIKYLLGYIRCFKTKIKHEKNIYIGKQVSIVGGRKINLKSNVIIRPYVDLWCTGNILIDEGSEIGTRSRISVANELQIGKNVLISPNVYITDCDHEYRNINLPIMQQGIVSNNNKVEIGDGSYIGIHAVIVGNVKIGRHCVIGANSVVTKDVPDYCVAVGSPAKIIKRYYPEIGEWRKV